MIVVQSLVRRTERCAPDELVDGIERWHGLFGVSRPAQVLGDGFPDQGGDRHLPAGRAKLQISESACG